MSVHLRFDWVDAGPSPDVVSQYTMAALSVEAGDAVVTGALDRQSGTYSRTVVVPLFGVAEWLVANWWHLWYEVGDASDAGEPPRAFESRHNLAFAGDGFVLPRLRMVPTTGCMRLEWTRYAPEYARIEFVDAGQHEVEREVLEPELRNLIEAVLERLRGQQETGEAAASLGRVWAAINEVDDEEREFCRAAALLGIDPFDTPDDAAGALAEFWERVDPSIREDALAVASADSLDGVARWLNQVMEAVAQPHQRNDWPRIRQTLPQPAEGEPWARGYELARVTRNYLGIGDGRFEIRDTGELAIPRQETHPPSARIYGLVGADTPACMTVPRGLTGTRFLLARALGDYLDLSTPGPGLLSSLETDRQAQSRAFAAELLAPAPALRQRIRGDRIDAEQVQDLCDEFGVSNWVIRHQIENQDPANIAGY